MKRSLKILVITVMIASMMLISVFSSFAISVDLEAKFAYKTFESKVNQGYSLPYRLHLPVDYDESKSYPVLIFLHGAGERGNDNKAHLNSTVQNLFITNSQFEQTVIICPQCPAGQQWVDFPWAKGNYSLAQVPESKALSTAYELLLSILDEYSCDKDRVYAMGLSMGGFGTWDLLARHGDTFAAGVPICGGGDPSMAATLKEIPIWTYHGTADPTVPYRGTEEMYNSIKAAGGEKITFTSLENAVHNVWGDATTNSELLSWLLAQKLSDRFPKEEVTTPTVEETTPETKPVATNEEDGGCKGSVISFAVPAVIALAATAVLKKKEERR